MFCAVSCQIALPGRVWYVGRRQPTKSSGRVYGTAPQKAARCEIQRRAMSLAIELDNDTFDKLIDFALEGAEVVVIIERLVQPRPRLHRSGGALLSGSCVNLAAAGFENASRHLSSGIAGA
jgi:hypothetical protein